MKEENTEWTTILRPHRSVFYLPWRDLWAYRDLLWLFVRRDFVSVYKQTILGPLWFFIQPVFTMLVFMFAFGRLAGLSTDGLPQPLFYLAGITCWNYFADCLTKTSTVFRDNAAIFGKVYFPRLITPLSIIISSLIRFGVQMLLFSAVLLWYLAQGAAVHVRVEALFLLPLAVLLMALLGLGLGLIVTALTTKYRDLSFLLVFGVQLLMYGTTVIYPLSAAPESIRWVIELHPMTGVIEMFRFAFLGQGTLTLALLGYSVGFALVVMVAGALIFNKAERQFIDTV